MSRPTVGLSVGVGWQAGTRFVSCSSSDWSSHASGLIASLSSCSRVLMTGLQRLRDGSNRQRSAEVQFGTPPTVLDFLNRDTEFPGCLPVLFPQIPKEVEHFLVFLAEFLDVLVEQNPLFQRSRLTAVPALRERPAGVICRDAVVGVVIGAKAKGALVMTGQVDQRPADLHSRQVPEVSGVLWHSRLKRPAEADQGSLQDVVGLFPAPDPGEPPEHLVGQVVEAVAGTSDEVVEGAAVAGAE